MIGIIYQKQGQKDLSDFWNSIHWKIIIFAIFFEDGQLNKLKLFGNL